MPSEIQAGLANTKSGVPKTSQNVFWGQPPEAPFFVHAYSKINTPRTGSTGHMLNTMQDLSCKTPLLQSFWNSVQPAINLNEPFQVVRYKLTNFLWSHFINHFNPLELVLIICMVCLVDSHCRLTLPTNSMYCVCVLSFMFGRLYWLFNVYFSATLEHTRVVCQPTSYHLFITIVFHYLSWL